MNPTGIRRISWCVLLLVCGTGSAQAASIYSLTTSLGPVSGSEFATGTVALSVDTTSVLTFGLAYQFQSRLAVLATLSAGGSSLLVATGLPSLSTLLFPGGSFSTSVVVDSSHFLNPSATLSALVGQSISISLTTSAGVLTGSGVLQGDRQGGFPGPPDFGEVPEPSTFGLGLTGVLLVAASVAHHHRKRIHRS